MALGARVGARLRPAVAGAGHRRRRDGARRARRDRQARGRAFPRRTAPVERSGVGADQRVVLRLLVARSGVRDRCHRPIARRARSRGRPALPAVPLARGLRRRRITFGGLAIIVGAWTIDALLQAITGTSPLFFGLDQIKHAISGHGMCTDAAAASVDRLSGFLGPCNLKLGQIVASLSPFALIAASKRWGILGWCVAAALVGAVILLSGTRAAWISYALVLLWSGWGLLGWKRLLAVFAFGAISIAALGIFVPQVQERLVRSTHLLAANESDVDNALSGRGRIWSAAWCMYRTHPINGVGARGFRDAFNECDQEKGQLAAWGEGPALHAHQLLLEVGSETGTFGLLMWLAGVALGWRAWRYSDANARDNARPAMLALAVTIFPFNTHLAFYSTFWGGVTLLLAALFSGSLLARDAEAATVAVPKP